ncbi:MAG: hypothetical protein RIE52_03810 [Balneola sp.]|jgi:hypothetical protein
MKKLLFLLVSLSLVSVSAQEVSVIDFVKTVDNNKEELIYYYESNWKVLRDIALEKDFIHSYELLITEADPAADFDVILITRYKNEKQYQQGEERFQQIIKERNKEYGGIRLLNELKPGEFRKNVSHKITRTKFSSLK